MKTRQDLFRIIRGMSLILISTISLIHNNAYADNFDEDFKSASRYEAFGLQEMALKSYMNLRKKYPNKFEAHSAYIRLKKSTGRGEEVKIEYNNILEKNPDDKTVLAVFGSMYEYNIQKSLNYYEKSLAIDPNYDIAISGIALRRITEISEYKEKGEYQDIIDKLKESLTRNVKSSSINLALGYAYYKNGNIKDAINYTSKSFGDLSRKLLALCSVAQYEFSRGNGEIGRKYIQDAMKLNPSHVLPYRVLADYYLKIGENTKALENYKRAMLANSESVAIYNNMAWLLATSQREMQDLELALRLVELAVKKSRRSVATILDTHAEIQFRLGNASKAVEIIDEALGLRPTNVVYYEKQRKRFCIAGGC